MPSIGVYLDEQPITTINQILDVHVYDIARVETLSGPQGTLFGQGSQAGTIRIITNKPDPGQFEAGYDAYVDTVSNGGEGYGLEGFVNIPIGRPRGGAPGRLAHRRRRLDRQRAGRTRVRGQRHREGQPGYRRRRLQHGQDFRRACLAEGRPQRQLERDAGDHVPGIESRG